MPVISITRLHLRSWRYAPQFAVYTLGSARQARRSDGFLGGALGNDTERGAWTMTAWRDEAAMRAFRNRGIHFNAMPRLLKWCDEASFAHWTQSDATLPSPEQAHRRMKTEGRLSKVSYPSAAHAAGVTASASSPRVGLRLTPRATRSA
jgi:heme-degrading monooxygenase HmoA